MIILRRDSQGGNSGSALMDKGELEAILPKDYQELVKLQNDKRLTCFHSKRFWSYDIDFPELITQDLDELYFDYVHGHVHGGQAQRGNLKLLQLGIQGHCPGLHYDLSRKVIYSPPSPLQVRSVKKFLLDWVKERLTEYSNPNSDSCDGIDSTDISDIISYIKVLKSVISSSKLT